MTGNEEVTHRGGGGDARTVANRLEELKERGCVAVATGQVPGDAMQAVTRHMFGDPALDRRRLFVSFKQLSDPADWLPGDLSIDHETVELRDRSEAIERAAVETTSETESTPMETPTPSPDAESVLGTKAQLDAITGDVVDVATALTSWQAGQLRVVVLRPDYLVFDSDQQTLAAIESFVERFRVLMQRFGGMGLLAVSKGPDDPVVDLLVDAVDLQFRVRKEWSFVEQQVVIEPAARDPLVSDWHELP